MSFQTPGGPAAKRRRIDAANATLRKPFRSPLIRQQDDGQPSSSESAQNSPSTSRAPSVASFTPVTPATPAQARRAVGDAAAAAAAASPLSASPSLTTTASSTPGLIKRSASLTSRPGRSSRATATTKPKHGGANSNNNTAEDDLLQQLQTSQRTLTTHLRTTQTKLDLVRQARQIEQAALAKRPGEAVDAELRDMVAKWKGVSRLAAEELFRLIRGRVEGMGGARAWRESRRWQQRAGGYHDDDLGGGFGWEGVVKGEGEGDGDGDGGEREVGDEEEEQEESEESEFTMVMMLKSLNIEPDVLGYDPVEDKWRD
ncbi:hypothetical protein C8A01DRAFT_35932 [Parachaetomium inaequale]|uniref:Swi5-dependent recombination DNA repair protein 1 n=1 Tax=Parachaetomium inaequale TaxID=2588326 RepID=A0AAN6PKC6_9PEZI|nr:hypothetical protein C8A01DRAFT_35932 [Parachaetomium inaequale]